MDIVAKKMPPDENGVRIAELDEMTYRKLLWEHTPLTDFWRVGKGIANRLAQYNILTMGDVARCSIEHEGFLYQMFGVNAELLIDHAWGWEPVTMEYVKAYKPESKSLSSGQVLQSAYTTDMARNVILEMADSVSLDLVDKRLLTDQLVLTVGYDIESLTNPSIREKYHGKITTDHYGRQVPVNAHGTINIEEPTSAGSIISEKVAELYGRIVNPVLLVRRLNLSVNHLVHEEQYKKQPKIVQLDLFTDYEESERQRNADLEKAEKERRRQEAILSIKKKFGKNAILKGINYADGATQKERNQQIGGHHVSKNRTPMSMENRAAQFAPFAALPGHDEAIAETARLTTPKKLLSDDEMASLTRKLTCVIEQVPGQEEYTFVHYVPDAQKEGGKYVSITGTVKKYDEMTRTITLSDGKVLLIDNILSIRRHGTPEL